MIIKRLTGLVALALAFAGLVAAPTSAQADPTRADPASAGVHDMRGHFAMFTRTIGDPNVRPGTLDITTQVGPVLTGRANLTGRPVPVAGTITPAGAVNLTGLDGLDLLTINARIPDLTDGGIVPCILEGRFRISSLTGAGAQGDLVAVHQVPDSGAPSLGGDYSGVMIQDVNDRTPVEARIDQSPTGALTGRMFSPQPDPPGLQLTIAGQVAWDNPELRPGILLVGAGPDVLMTALLHPVSIEDPDIRGPARLLSPDGTVTPAALQLEQVSR